VQLRADGTLLFSPDAGFGGAVDFSYAIERGDGALTTAQVHVDVKSDLTPTAVSVNDVPVVSETNGQAEADIKVGEIVVADAGKDVLDGGDGDNKSYGETGNEALTDGKSAEVWGGGAGNDILSGGEGSDMLLFRSGFGNNTVSQFGDTATDQDVIDLSHSGYATFEALQAAGALAQVGADVVITLNPQDPANSDKIVLKSLNLSTLDASDFRFL
jgi:Ca2+-binding RTX toxin-like protein